MYGRDQRADQGGEVAASPLSLPQQQQQQQQQQPQQQQQFRQLEVQTAMQEAAQQAAQMVSSAQHQHQHQGGGEPQQTGVVGSDVTASKSAPPESALALGPDEGTLRHSQQQQQSPPSPQACEQVGETSSPSGSDQVRSTRCTYIICSFSHLETFVDSAVVFRITCAFPDSTVPRHLPRHPFPPTTISPPPPPLSLSLFLFLSVRACVCRSFFFQPILC